MLATSCSQHGRPDDKVGVCWLPGGDELYRKLARVHTTTDRTPDDLHQTGLDIIERLTEEYAEIGAGCSARATAPRSSSG